MRGRSEIYKFVNTESGLVDNGAQGAFRDVFPWVIGNNGSSVSFGIIPDFMAANCRHVATIGRHGDLEIKFFMGSKFV